MTLINTDYGDYDDEDVESMLNYCCRIRGNPLELVDRTINEFSWFIDSATWGSIQYPKTLKQIGEVSEIHKYYSKWEDDSDSSSLVKWCRMFVHYCIEEYCND